MYDKEKRALAFKELQEEEVEKYEPSEELKKFMIAIKNHP